MSAEKSLTHARALELFDYNTDTGIITWRIAKARRVRPGMPAGHMSDGGHISIRVDGFPYQASHIAVLMATGELPSGSVKHLDGDMANNSISNLKLPDER